VLENREQAEEESTRAPSLMNLLERGPYQLSSIDGDPALAPLHPKIAEVLNEEED